jgi:DNA-binding transcriptional LysR family regulator
MILNINQLRAFSTAARLKSVTKAAQELMVSTPAITMQIRRFEEALGLRLTFRQGNSIQLTRIGRIMFAKSDRIFKQIKDMEGFLAGIAKDKAGILRVSCPQTPAKYFMPSLLTIFKKIYPNVKIVMDQGTSSEIVESIQNQKVDLGVIYCGHKHKRMKVKPLVKEEILLVAAVNSSHFLEKEISVNQLSTAPLIVPEEGSATREVVFAYLRKFNVKPVIAMESASVELIKQLVRQDQGVTFLVRSAVRDELHHRVLKVVPIVEGSPTIEYGIAYLQRKYLSPGAWAFVRLLEVGGQRSLTMTQQKK